MLLVATHEEQFRKDFKNVMTQRGEVCLEADTGEETLAQVDQTQPDMILLDLYIEKPSGLEVLRRLRAGGYCGKIVVLAGHSVQSMAPDVFRLGAFQIVGRPLDIQHAMSALRVVEGELGPDSDSVSS